MTLATLKRLEEFFRSQGNTREADVYKAKAEARAKKLGLGGKASAKKPA